MGNIESIRLFIHTRKKEAKGAPPVGKIATISSEEQEKPILTFSGETPTPKSERESSAELSTACFSLEEQKEQEEPIFFSEETRKVFIDDGFMIYVPNPERESSAELSQACEPRFLINSNKLSPTEKEMQEIAFHPKYFIYEDSCGKTLEEQREMIRELNEKCPPGARAIIGSVDDYKMITNFYYNELGEENIELSLFFNEYGKCSYTRTTSEVDQGKVGWRKVGWIKIDEKEVHWGKVDKEEVDWSEVSKEKNGWRKIDEGEVDWSKVRKGEVDWSKVGKGDANWGNDNLHVVSLADQDKVNVLEIYSRPKSSVAFGNFSRTSHPVVITCKDTDKVRSLGIAPLFVPSRNSQLVSASA